MNRIALIREKMFNYYPFCTYCNSRLTFEESTLDHYLPKSHGGDNKRDNLVLSCSKCNQDKQDKVIINGPVSMKEYPKIIPFDKTFIGRPFIAQVKHDGSNLRFEYSRKRKKWNKYGTRHRLFSSSDPEYGPALPIFYEKYADGLAKIFTDNKAWRSSDNIIAFAEYFGPNSFSGKHQIEEKDLVLFDVNVHKRGILSPEEFMQHFGHLNVVKTVYTGTMSEEFFHDVRNGKYPVEEGVICKGGSGHDLWICKIKTLKYLEKLKESFGNNWHEHWE